MNQPVILVAEDDEEDRFLLQEAIRRCGLPQRFHFVGDGTEAMAYLRNQGKYADAEAHPRPTLFLLDLNMPKMDGREVLKEVKRDENLRAIPIVVLTTSREKEDLADCYDLGANSFISKPFDINDLESTMEVLNNYWYGIVNRRS